MMVGCPCEDYRNGHLDLNERVSFAEASMKAMKTRMLGNRKDIRDSYNIIIVCNCHEMEASN